MAAKLREEVIDRVLDCLERGFSPALVTCRAASGRIIRLAPARLAVQL
jgi:hypothetical protein